MHPRIPYWESGLSISLLQPPPQRKPSFCLRCESRLFSVNQCSLWLLISLNKELLHITEFSSSLNGTHKPLSVNLTSSLVDGGPVHVSVCVFSSLCQYYSVKEKRWSSDGLQPLEGSTLHAARCLTQHLTVFGASLFVHPGAVVLLAPVCENTKHYTSCYLVHIFDCFVKWIPVIHFPNAKSGFKRG